MRRTAVVYGCILGIVLGLGGCETAPTRFNEPSASAPPTKGSASADIYANLAAEYLSRGQLEVALTKGRQAIRVDRRNGDANNVMGLIYQRLGEPDQADRYFKRALSADPTNPYYLNAYGSFLCSQKRFEDAEMRFSKAAANPLNRSPEIALTNAGICALVQPEGRAKAETFFRRALEKNRRFPMALLQMAKLSFEAGEFLAARAYIERFGEVSPLTPGGLWLAIRTERQLGDDVAAAKYEMRLQSKFPDSPEIQLLRESRKP